MVIVRFWAFVSSGKIPRFKLRANVCSVMWSCTSLFFPCSY